MWMAVIVLGYECSSTSSELVDKRRRHSRPISIFRISSEASCDTAATAVGLSRTVSHCYKFVLCWCILVLVWNIVATLHIGNSCFHGFHGWPFVCIIMVLREWNTSWYLMKLPRPTQPGHPSMGRQNEYQRWLWLPLGKKWQVLHNNEPCDQYCWHTDSWIRALSVNRAGRPANLWCMAA